MTAVSTVSVEIKADKAIVTLQDIKRNTENTTSAIEKLRQAANGGFDKLAQAMARLEPPLQKIMKEMEAIRLGMRNGTDAALKQATAMDRLAQSVTRVGGAQAKANQTRQNDLAAAKSWEAALTRELGLRERIRRQLTGDDRATVRDQLGDQLTSAMTAYQTALTKYGTGSKEGIAAKGTLSREFTLVSSKIAEVNGLLPVLDRGFDKVSKSSKGWTANLSQIDKMQMRSWAVNVPQQIISSGGNVGSALAVQGPEMLAVLTKLPPQAMAVAAAFVAVGGALAVVGSGFSRLFGDAQKMREFTVAIQGSGQAGKVAAADLQTMVDRLDSMPGVARDAAEATVAALARIRGLGQQNMGRIATLSPDFAAGAGLEQKDATAKLATYFKAPAEGARALATEYGALSAASAMLVEKLMRQGKVTEAQGIIAGALERQFKGLADKGLSPIDRALSAVGNTWGAFTRWLADSSVIIAAANSIEWLAKATERLFNARKQFDAGGSPVLSMPMPAPLPPGALPQTQDKGAEVLGAIDALKQYQGVTAQRRELADIMARGQSALKIATDPAEIKALKEGLAGAAEAMRQLVDAKQKLVGDAQRSAANEWRIAESPYDQRDSLRTQIEAETQAREAGLSAMQKEDLIRARLSEGAAKYLTGIQDSVRAKGYEVDATERLLSVETGSIAERQRMQDILAKEEFRRTALQRATAANRDEILAEVAAFDQLIDRMGKAATASQYKSMAQSYSPTMQDAAFRRDAPGIEAAMRSGGATQDEITQMYEEAELRKLDASRRWEDGVTRGLKRVQSDATNFARMSETAITNSLSTVEDAFVRMAETGKFNFKDLARSIIGDLIRIQTRMTITAPLAGAMNGLFGGGAKTGGTAGAPTSLMPGEWDNGNLIPKVGDWYACGGAFSSMGKLHAFAKGGAFTNSIVSSPTLFKFAQGSQFGVMGEAGAEAVMPLRRGPDGSLGVMVAGGGGSAPIVNTTVNVSVEGPASSGDTAVDERQAQRIAKAVDAQVRATVVSELQRQMRSGGMLNRV